MERFMVRVGKEDLRFSAGHFITAGTEGCESLHGHDFRVAVEIEAPLNDDHLVVDFFVLKQALRSILQEVDHRFLVPLRDRQLHVEQDAKHVRLRFREKEWMFPRQDCALLPLESTTAELLAFWVSGRLREALPLRSPEAPPYGCLWRLRVEVEESPGQSAVHETTLGGTALDGTALGGTTLGGTGAPRS